MPVKYAVLGLLLERRGYGYDLVQRLNERLGPAWQLNPSAVYTALDRLENDGLIVEAERDGASPEIGSRPNRRDGRVVYEPTGAGAEAFGAWLAQPSHRHEPVRPAWQLKVAIARREDVPKLLHALEHEAVLAQLLCEECLDMPDFDNGTAEWSDAVAVLIREAAVARVRGELRWIRTARDVLQAFGKGNDPL